MEAGTSAGSPRSRIEGSCEFPELPGPPLSPAMSARACARTGSLGGARFASSRAQHLIHRRNGDRSMIQESVVKAASLQQLFEDLDAGQIALDRGRGLPRRDRSLHRELQARLIGELAQGRARDWAGISTCRIGSSARARAAPSQQQESAQPECSIAHGDPILFLECSHRTPDFRGPGRGES